MRYRFLRFPGGKTKAVTFSYDDGTREDIRLAETLDKYGLKCTFNINSGMLGKGGEGRLSAGEIEQHLLAGGHEIAMHGLMHRAPGAQRSIEGIRDVLDCRLGLERAFGQIVRGMAYPDSGIRNMQNGASYENIRQYLKDLDITYARTLGGDNDLFRMPDDWYAWMPTAHHDNPQVLEWAEKFVSMDVEAMYSASRFPRLFYLWGHSYEFERNGNWEHLDEICEKLSGYNDIWYAANGEIRDYTEAYDSLVFSADGTRVYNPTLLTVWFDLDGTLYTIGSGETLVTKE